MAHNIENADRSLQKLLAKIQQRSNSVRDFMTPTDQLVYRTDAGNPEIILEGQGEPTKFFGVNSVAFDQIAREADIDVRTARKLQSGYSDEWDQVVNAIWQKEPKRRMLRTFLCRVKTPERRRLLFLTSSKHMMILILQKPFYRN